MKLKLVVYHKTTGAIVRFQSPSIETIGFWGEKDFVTDSGLDTDDYTMGIYRYNVNIDPAVDTITIDAGGDYFSKGDVDYYPIDSARIEKVSQKMKEA